MKISRRLLLIPLLLLAIGAGIVQAQEPKPEADARPADAAITAAPGDETAVFKPGPNEPDRPWDALKIGEFSLVELTGHDYGAETATLSARAGPARTITMIAAVIATARIAAARTIRNTRDGLIPRLPSAESSTSDVESRPCFTRRSNVPRIRRHPQDTCGPARHSARRPARSAPARSA